MVFWKDTWLGDVPIHVQYPKLLKLSGDPDALVKDCVMNNNWKIEFKRSLNQFEQGKLQELYGKLQEVTLNDNEDEVF